MSINAIASEQAAVVATIDPDVIVASTVLSDYVDASKYANFMATVLAGTLGASATLDAKLVQATDGSGTDVKDITGKAITQLTQASPDDSDKQAVINLRPEELDVANDFTHFALSLTIGTATSDAGAIVQGLDARHGPASDNDLASVAEIVD